MRQILSGYYHKLFRHAPSLERVQLLGRELLLYKGTVHKEDKDDAWFYALARHADTIYDIGCNIGYAALLATVQSPGKKIFLADPNIAALTQAADNLIRNGLSVNKMFIRAFVSDKPGDTLKFYTIGTGAAGSMFGSHAETAFAANSYQWVDTVTIDKIVDDTSYLPDLVKIDVEGAESLALKGSERLAALQKTIFMVEMHGPKEMPMLKNAELVLGWCRANNYDAHYMAKHQPLTSPEQLSERGRCHLLLVPAGTEYPAYLKEISEGAKLYSVSPDAIRKINLDN